MNKETLKLLYDKGVRHQVAKFNKLLLMIACPVISADEVITEDNSTDEKLTKDVYILHTDNMVSRMSAYLEYKDISSVKHNITFVPVENEEAAVEWVADHSEEEITVILSVTDDIATTYKNVYNTTYVPRVIVIMADKDNLEHMPLLLGGELINSDLNTSDARHFMEALLESKVYGTETTDKEHQWNALWQTISMGQLSAMVLSQAYNRGVEDDGFFFYDDWKEGLANLVTDEEDEEDESCPTT